MFSNLQQILYHHTLINSLILDWKQMTQDEYRRREEGECYILTLKCPAESEIVVYAYQLYN